MPVSTASVPCRPRKVVELLAEMVVLFRLPTTDQRSILRSSRAPDEIAAYLLSPAGGERALRELRDVLTELFMRPQPPEHPREAPRHVAPMADTQLFLRSWRRPTEIATRSMIWRGASPVFGALSASCERRPGASNPAWVVRTGCAIWTPPSRSTSRCSRSPSTWDTRTG